MMLSKEECENCVGVFTDKICLSCPNEHCSVNCEVHKSENQIYEFIDKHFELIEILKEVGWDGFNIGDLKTIIKAGQYNAEKLNSLRKPYKFEDLKPGMWVWDSKIEKCNKILEINNDKIGFYYVTDNLTRFTCKFEENRFYPVQMANGGGFL